MDYFCFAVYVSTLLASIGRHRATIPPEIFGADVQPCTTKVAGFAFILPRRATLFFLVVKKKQYTSPKSTKSRVAQNKVIFVSSRLSNHCLVLGHQEETFSHKESDALQVWQRTYNSAVHCLLWRQDWAMVKGDVLVEEA